MRVLTLATLRSLPRASALSRSLKRHEPAWAHEILVIAGEEVSASLPATHPELCLRSIREELDLDLEALLALHDPEDLISLLLPRVLLHYAARASEPIL